MTAWPDGMTVKPIVTWPGAMHSDRPRSLFSATWGATLGLITSELGHLRAKDVVLQVAIDPQQFRLDGFPRAGAKQIHPGIILTMSTRVGPLSYPCDTYATWRENLRAIALALEALRKVDRYGVTRRGEQYQGFAAIEARPAGPAVPFSDPDTALVWLSDQFGTPGIINTASWLVGRGKRVTHPDVGGDAEQFDVVMKAESILRKAGRL